MQNTETFEKIDWQENFGKAKLNLISKFKIQSLTFLLFFVLSTTITFAQSFVASVSPNPVPEGERFRLTFTVNAEGKNFRPPTFKGFSILAGPSQSSNFQMMNGRTSYQFSFTYECQAGKKGDYVVDAATIQVGNNTIKSNPLTIRVVEASEALKQKRQQEKNEQESLNDQAMKIIKDNLMLKVSASKQTVYQGEQISLYFKLYINQTLNLINIGFSKAPSYNGFWSQELSEKEQKTEYEKIDGAVYKTISFKKVILYPQQSGKLTIDPMELNSKVRLQVQGGQRNRRSIFDDFFDNSSYRDFDYILKSQPLTINVLPLPANAPSDFTGGVGKLNMEAWLDKTKTVANEPVTLKVKISGDGNLKLIEQLKVNFPQGFEAYDPKTADNTTVTIAGTTGNKVFEYLAIPRTPGKYKIGPISFSYFDLAKKDYITITSKEFEIEVGKGDGSTDAGASISGVRKEELQYLGKDIRYIKSNVKNFNQSASNFYGSGLFYGMMGLPLFSLFAFIFIKRKQDEQNKDKHLVKNRKAAKVAMKHLAIAKKLKDNAADKDKFYEEISKALWGYVADKLTISPADLTKDKVKSELQSKKVDEVLIAKLIQTIDTCEFARYAPGAVSASTKEIYDDSEKLIISLEDEFKS